MIKQEQGKSLFPIDFTSIPLQLGLGCTHKSARALEMHFQGSSGHLELACSHTPYTDPSCSSLPVIWWPGPFDAEV